jgi:UDP-glucose 4-epimerase
VNPDDLCLVTGGAGFIGSNLVRALVGRGARVRIFDNFSTGLRSNVEDLNPAGVEIVEADLRDEKAVGDAARGVRYVFHLGAIPSIARSVDDPASSNAVNVTGTLNVLIAARNEQVARMVFASSSSIYGNAERLPVVETDTPHPISPYGVSKLAGESYLSSFHSSYKTPGIALRYFNVFGPRQNPDSEYAAVVPRFISASLAGKSVTIFGDGEQTRDFTFVEDVVEANLAAAEAPERALGRAFNVARGNPNSVNRLLEVIQERTPGQPVHPVHAQARVGDVRASVADVSLARAELGFSARRSLEEGLGITVDWFAARPARA